MTGIQTEEYGYYIMNFWDSRQASFLPIRGKHRAHVGKAPCPGWVSSVPIFLVLPLNA